MDEQYSYDEETLLKKYKKIARDDGTGGVILLTQLTLLLEFEN